MTERIETCLIWGNSYKAKGTFDPIAKMYEVEDSDRAFSGYKVSKFLLDLRIKRLSDREKAWLTTWIVDQFNLGNYHPEITPHVLQSVLRKRSLRDYQRADRLLEYIAIASSIEKVGVPLRFLRTQYELFAWSESVEWSEIEYLLDYLSKKGWMEAPEPCIPGSGWTVTVECHSRVEELDIRETTSDRSQAFVAMWFDDRMTEAYEKGIGPAVETAGYKPLVINRKEHINRIDDEIEAEIRRSRFVVADFTHGDAGARGGVYYEAGLAKGRDLPVIFTCHEDSLGTLHFDTNHYNHIVWSTPEDLLEKLNNRILSVIGEGPGA